MRLIVGVNGLVEDAAVLRSSAFPRLDRAAIEIARHYQYQPVLEDGSIKVADSKATGGVINHIECWNPSDESLVPTMFKHSIT